MEALRERVGDDRRAELDRLIGVLEGHQVATPNPPGQASPTALGSSAAPSGARPSRDLVYISYRDREWQQRLRRVLDADPRLGGRVWDDTEIPADADWQREIDEHVPRARVMIMLASDDYFDPAVSGAFASEVVPALAAREQGELAILWLPVRPMSIAAAPVRHITAATGAGTVPLALLPPDGQAQALIRVYGEVLRLLGLPAEPLSPAVRMAAQSPADEPAQDTTEVPPQHALGSRPMPESSTILFLAASPDGEQKLALDREAREIRSKIRAAEHRDSLVFHTEWAVRPDDLLQYLNELRPQAVHFSGHGTTGELILNDEDGRAKPVSRDALRALFGLHAKTVRLVVLNACFSKAQADAIVEVIDCAVGMSQAIGDEAAIVFAAAFYRKLGFGDSVQAAFDEGRVALMLQGIPEEKTPVLLVRNGVDASQVFLVGPSANPS